MRESLAKRWLRPLISLFIIGCVTQKVLLEFSQFSHFMPSNAPAYSGALLHLMS